MLLKAFGNQKNITAFLLFAFAAIVGIITIYHHEMWRDESQAFLIVRDSKNLIELWQNVRYEGHPVLWYGLLYISYHIFTSVYTIQVIHLIIGLGVVALIARHSPFLFFEKFLLIFSYFFSYEYLVISRNYAVGILFLFAAIVVFYKKNSASSFIVVAILLGVSANANIYALIIAFWLFIYFLSQQFKMGLKDRCRKREFYSSITLFVLLNVVAALQLISPADRTPKIRVAYVVSIEKLDKVFGEIAGSMFYLADPGKNEKFWGSDVFKNNFFPGNFYNNFFHHLPAFFAFVTIIIFCFSACKRNGALLFYIPAFVTLSAFTFMVFDKGFLRHTGAFFVLFIAAYWICRQQNSESRWLKKILQKLFVLMLFFQLISSIIVHLKDLKYSFSSAKNAAGFLKSTKRDSGRILIHPDFYGMSVVHYAELNKVYYPISERWGSFVKFDSARKPHKISEILSLANTEKIETIIFNSRLSDTVLTKIGFESVYTPAFSSTAAGEDFFIYGRKNK